MLVLVDVHISVSTLDHTQCPPTLPGRLETIGDVVDCALMVLHGISRTLVIEELLNVTLLFFLLLNWDLNLKCSAGNMGASWTGSKRANLH